MRHPKEVRAALVTGATSGIGEAVVERLALAGISTLGLGRQEERLSALQKRLTGLPGAVHGYGGDLRDPSYFEAAIERAEGLLGQPPTIFVLSAGHGIPGTLLTSDPSRWRDLLEVNYLALMHQMRDCARYALVHGEEDIRDIVVVGSTIGRQVSAFNPVYGSSKFAVHSLVEALRQEICGNGVRVTLVEPGFVRTGFQANAGYDLGWFEQVEVDMGPFLDAHDVARTIEFVVGQPAHVHLDNIRIRPTRQRT